MGGIGRNKKVKEIFYPDWEDSMNIFGGFQEEQIDAAEGRGVVEGET